MHRWRGGETPLTFDENVPKLRWSCESHKLPLLGHRRILRGFDEDESERRAKRLPQVPPTRIVPEPPEHDNSVVEALRAKLEAAEKRRETNRKFAASKAAREAKGWAVERDAYFKEMKIATSEAEEAEKRVSNMMEHLDDCMKKGQDRIRALDVKLTKLSASATVASAVRRSEVAFARDPSRIAADKLASDERAARTRELATRVTRLEEEVRKAAARGAVAAVGSRCLAQAERQQERRQEFEGKIDGMVRTLRDSKMQVSISAAGRRNARRVAQFEAEAAAVAAETRSRAEAACLSVSSRVETLETQLETAKACLRAREAEMMNLATPPPSQATPSVSEVEEGNLRDDDVRAPTPVPSKLSDTTSMELLDAVPPALVPVCSPVSTSEDIALKIRSGSDSPLSIGGQQSSSSGVSSHAIAFAFDPADLISVECVSEPSYVPLSMDPRSVSATPPVPLSVLSTSSFQLVPPTMEGARPSSRQSVESATLPGAQGIPSATSSAPVSVHMSSLAPSATECELRYDGEDVSVTPSSHKSVDNSSVAHSDEAAAVDGCLHVFGLGISLPPPSSCPTFPAEVAVSVSCSGVSMARDVVEPMVSPSETNGAALHDLEHGSPSSLGSISAINCVSAKLFGEGDVPRETPAASVCNTASFAPPSSAGSLEAACLVSGMLAGERSRDSSCLGSQTSTHTIAPSLAWKSADTIGPVPRHREEPAFASATLDGKSIFSVAPSNSAAPSAANLAAPMCFEDFVKDTDDIDESSLAQTIIAPTSSEVALDDRAMLLVQVVQDIASAHFNGDMMERRSQSRTTVRPTTSEASHEASATMLVQTMRDSASSQCSDDIDVISQSRVDFGPDSSEVALDDRATFLIEAVRSIASTHSGSDDDGVISQSEVNVRPASSEVALSHRATLLMKAVQGISSTPSCSADVDATSVSQCDVRPASSEVALFDRAALLVEAVHDIASFSASSRPVSASSVSARAPRASHEVSTGAMEGCVELDLPTASGSSDGDERNWAVPAIRIVGADLRPPASPISVSRPSTRGPSRMMTMSPVSSCVSLVPSVLDSTGVSVASVSMVAQMIRQSLGCAGSPSGPSEPSSVSTHEADMRSVQSHGSQALMDDLLMHVHPLRSSKRLPSGVSDASQHSRMSGPATLKFLPEMSGTVRSPTPGGGSEISFHTNASQFDEAPGSVVSHALPCHLASDVTGIIEGDVSVTGDETPPGCDHLVPVSLHELSRRLDARSDLSSCLELDDLSLVREVVGNLMTGERLYLEVGMRTTSEAPPTESGSLFDGHLRHGAFSVDGSFTTPVGDVDGQSSEADLAGVACLELDTVASTHSHSCKGVNVEPKTGFRESPEGVKPDSCVSVQPHEKDTAEVESLLDHCLDVIARLVDDTSHDSSPTIEGIRSPGSNTSSQEVLMVLHCLRSFLPGTPECSTSHHSEAVPFSQSGVHDQILRLGSAGPERLHSPSGVHPATSLDRQLVAEVLRMAERDQASEVDSQRRGSNGQSPNPNLEGRPATSESECQADHERSSITEDVLAHVIHALRSGFRGSVAASSSAHGFQQSEHEKNEQAPEFQIERGDSHRDALAHVISALRSGLCGSSGASSIVRGVQQADNERTEQAPEFQMERNRPLSSGSNRDALAHVICAVRSGLPCGSSSGASSMVRGFRGDQVSEEQVQGLARALEQTINDIVHASSGSDVSHPSEATSKLPSTFNLNHLLESDNDAASDASRLSGSVNSRSSRLRAELHHMTHRLSQFLEETSTGQSESSRVDLLAAVLSMSKVVQSRELSRSDRADLHQSALLLRQAARSSDSVISESVSDDFSSEVEQIIQTLNRFTTSRGGQGRRNHPSPIPEVRSGTPSDETSARRPVPPSVASGSSGSSFRRRRLQAPSTVESTSPDGLCNGIARVLVDPYNASASGSVVCEEDGSVPLCQSTSHASFLYDGETSVSGMDLAGREHFLKEVWQTQELSPTGSSVNTDPTPSPLQQQFFTAASEATGSVGHRSAGDAGRKLLRRHPGEALTSYSPSTPCEDGLCSRGTLSFSAVAALHTVTPQSSTDDEIEDQTKEMDAAVLVSVPQAHENDDGYDAMTAIEVRSAIFAPSLQPVEGESRTEVEVVDDTVAGSSLDLRSQILGSTGDQDRGTDALTATEVRSAFFAPSFQPVEGESRTEVGVVDDTVAGSSIHLRSQIIGSTGNQDRGTVSDTGKSDLVSIPICTDAALAADSAAPSAAMPETPGSGDCLVLAPASGDSALRVAGHVIETRGRSEASSVVATSVAGSMEHSSATRAAIDSISEAESGKACTSGGHPSCAAVDVQRQVPGMAGPESSVASEVADPAAPLLGTARPNARSALQSRSVTPALSTDSSDAVGPAKKKCCGIC